ncbi:hypothetical protein SUDANB145_07204 (plasmid) [Streptomyces sp. enrichment culture]|uniref:hypothetical protein n=1 Tax=Streptomyces sp. enrichment culture TaxID=1795815 RepID=UPI003F54D2E6
MTTTWDALKKRLDSIKLPTATFTICEDPDVRAALHRAKDIRDRAAERLDAVTDDTDPATKDLLVKRLDNAEGAVSAAQKAYDKASVTLRFTALERRALEDLQRQHPPKEEAEATGDDFDLGTFAPALISAASLDGMPVEDAKHFLDTWSTADAQGLWRAAWSIQQQQRTDLGKG